MIAPSPSHVVEAILREVPGARRVLRTRFEGVACVTRVLTAGTVDPALGPDIEQIVLHGRGNLVGASEELLLTLEGYRVATMLPHPDPRWPQALAAGVSDDGYAYITTRWIEGIPLHHVSEVLPAVERRVLAASVLCILAELHSRRVVHGDLKPENIVLLDDGGAAVIDLDTLRVVRADDRWAITRDLTRSWASPEQEAQQRTFLASDLWAWARLVHHLFPEGPPVDWRLPLEACRLGDPLRRPRTSELLRALGTAPSSGMLDWLGRSTPPTGSTATERVPEAPRSPRPVGTERVAETTSGSTLSLPPAPAPPVPRRRRSPVVTCLVVAGIVPLALAGLCSGVFGWRNHARAVRADALAEETMGALKAHKVRRELNTDPQRQTLALLANAAWETRHTDRSSAVRALAFVWAQGWQDSGRAWSGSRYDEGVSALSDVHDSREPEALLALGTLYGASCRLNRRDAQAAVHCDRAIESLAAFQKRLPSGVEHHWLRVEGAWTEVLVRSDMAFQAIDAKLPDANAQLRSAIAGCAAAEPWLPYAPINGPELLQDCLSVAGAAEDLDAYFRWADLLVASDLADGTMSRENLRRFYGAAGLGCDEAVFEANRRGGWVAKGPAWCLAVGHAARRCYDDAAAEIVEGTLADPGRPWAAVATRMAARAGDCIP